MTYSYSTLSDLCFSCPAKRNPTPARKTNVGAESSATKEVPGCTPFGKVKTVVGLREKISSARPKEPNSRM